MKKSDIALLSLLLVLLVPAGMIAQEPTAGNSQDTLLTSSQDTMLTNPQVTIQEETQGRVRPYLNLGYITNLQKCSECTKRDQGFSVRIGLLTRGRFGFYAGYLWFKEFHTDNIGYDDKGAGLMAGLDFMLLKRGDFRWYVNLGIFNEKFTSTYPGGSETETSIKPDFGVLFNINHFNASLGWQPSEPHHINLGVGVTF